LEDVLLALWLEGDSKELQHCALFVIPGDDRVDPDLTFTTQQATLAAATIPFTSWAVLVPLSMPSVCRKLFA